MVRALCGAEEKGARGVSDTDKPGSCFGLNFIMPFELKILLATKTRIISGWQNARCFALARAGSNAPTETDPQRVSDFLLALTAGFCDPDSHSTNAIDLPTTSGSQARRCEWSPNGRKKGCVRTKEYGGTKPILT